MKYLGALFDLDGVILPSDKLHFLAWKKVCSFKRIFLYENAYQETLGISKREALEKILSHAKIDLDDKSKEDLILLKDHYYEEYLKSIDSSFVPNNVIEVLDYLYEKRVIMVIASSSKHAETLINKTNLRKYFPFIVSGKDIVNPKPHSEVFLKALEKTLLNKKNAVIIEDSIAGIEGGNNANIDTILISNHRSSLATYNVKNIKEIVPFF